MVEIFSAAFLAKPAIIGLIKFVTGLTVTYFTAKPLIEKWGGTPINRAAELGISPEDALEYAQKNKKNKLKHAKEKAEERNKELKEENEKLKEDLKKLEQRKLKEQEDWKNEQNEGERKRKFAILQNTEAEIKDKRSEIKKNEQEIKKNEKEVLDMYDELADGAEKLTIEQMKAKNSRPDVGYWFNWIVIVCCGIFAVYLINWAFAWLKEMKKK